MLWGVTDFILHETLFPAFSLQTHLVSGIQVPLQNSCFISLDMNNLHQSLLWLVRVWNLARLSLCCFSAVGKQNMRVFMKSTGVFCEIFVKLFFQDQRLQCFVWLWSFSLQTRVSCKRNIPGKVFLELLDLLYGLNLESRKAAQLLPSKIEVEDEWRSTYSECYSFSRYVLADECYQKKYFSKQKTAQVRAFQPHSVEGVRVYRK